eukprot:124003-Chlamydomonas_euryale.AAC.16
MAVRRTRLFQSDTDLVVHDELVVDEVERVRLVRKWVGNLLRSMSTLSATECNNILSHASSMIAAHDSPHPHPT